jgi:hypothetical protein
MIKRSIGIATILSLILGIIIGIGIGIGIGINKANLRLGHLPAKQLETVALNQLGNSQLLPSLDLNSKLDLGRLNRLGLEKQNTLPLAASADLSSQLLPVNLQQDPGLTQGLHELNSLELAG